MPWLLYSPAAYAGSIRLEVDTQPDCPTRERFERSVRAALPTVRFDPLGVPVRARFWILDGTARGRVEIAGWAREISTQGACDTLSDAVALVVALVAPGLEAPAKAPEVVVKPPPPTPASEVESGQRPWALALSAVGATGVSPEISTGFGGQFEWHSDNLVVAGGGRLLLPSTAEFNGGQVEANLWQVHALGCYAFEALDLCSGVQMGRQTATSHGFQAAQVQQANYLAVAAQVRRSWHITDAWALGGTFELVAPISRMTLRVDDEIAFETQPIAFVAGLSTSVHFGAGR